MATNCNLNCICMNSDCKYDHFISYKERKIVKRFYDAISKKNINEPNMDMRKKNCTFGQLCEKENCGYKHRLSFADREKLIVSYKFNKICPEPSQVAKTSNTKPDEPRFDMRNLFALLEVGEKEVKEEVKEVIQSSAKSWASVVKNEDAEIAKAIALSWGDCGDEEFYMTFD